MRGDPSRKIHGDVVATQYKSAARMNRPRNRWQSWWSRPPFRPRRRPDRPHRRSGSQDPRHRTRRHRLDVQMSQRSTTSRFLTTVVSEVTTFMWLFELAGHHAFGVADALDAVDRIAGRQGVQHGAAVAGRMVHAGGGDSRNIGRRHRAARCRRRLRRAGPASGHPGTDSNTDSTRTWPCPRQPRPPGGPPARIRRDRPQRRP